MWILLAALATAAEFAPIEPKSPDWPDGVVGQGTTCRMRLAVRADGTVVSAEPEQCDDRFQAAATAALLTWRFPEFEGDDRPFVVNVRFEPRKAPPDLRPIRMVPPTYPRAGFNLFLEDAACKVRLTLREDGTVSDVASEDCLEPFFASARAALAQWRFPAASAPGPRAFVVKVEFQTEDRRFLTAEQWRRIRAAHGALPPDDDPGCRLELTIHGDRAINRVHSDAIPKCLAIPSKPWIPRQLKKEAVPPPNCVVRFEASAGKARDIRVEGCEKKYRSAAVYLVRDWRFTSPERPALPYTVTIHWDPSPIDETETEDR